MADVLFSREPSIGSFGRSGIRRQSGLALRPLANDVEIRPITSQGRASLACFMTIPVEDIPKLIQVLIATAESAGVEPFGVPTCLPLP